MTCTTLFKIIEQIVEQIKDKKVCHYLVERSGICLKKYTVKKRNS